MNMTVLFSIGDVIEFDIGKYTQVGIIIELRDAGEDREVSILQNNGRVRKRMLDHDAREGSIRRLYHYTGVDYPVRTWDEWLNSQT